MFIQIGNPCTNLFLKFINQHLMRNAINTFAVFIITAMLLCTGNTDIGFDALTRTVNHTADDGHI